jgi:hypothetical protein
MQLVAAPGCSSTGAKSPPPVERGEASPSRALVPDLAIKHFVELFREHA